MSMKHEEHEAAFPNVIRHFTLFLKIGGRHARFIRQCCTVLVAALRLTLNPISSACPMITGELRRVNFTRQAQERRQG